MGFQRALRCQPVAPSCGVLYSASHRPRSPDFLPLSLLLPFSRVAPASQARPDPTARERAGVRAKDGGRPSKPTSATKRPMPGDPPQGPHHASASRPEAETDARRRPPRPLGADASWAQDRARRVGRLAPYRDPSRSRLDYPVPEGENCHQPRIFASTHWGLTRGERHWRVGPHRVYGRCLSPSPWRRPSAGQESNYQFVTQNKKSTSVGDLFNSSRCLIFVFWFVFLSGFRGPLVKSLFLQYR